MKKFSDVFENLKMGWNERSWWLKWMFGRTALGELLKSEDVPSAHRFFNVYLSSWWWNRLLFRSFIKDRAPLLAFDGLWNAAYLLKQHGLYTAWNLIAIARKGGHFVGMLYKFGLLDQENLSSAGGSAYPYAMTNALSYLQQNRLLTTNNRRALTVHPDILTLSIALRELSERGFLNQALFDNIIKLSNLRPLTIRLSRAEPHPVKETEVVTLVAQLYEATFDTVDVRNENVTKEGAVVYNGVSRYGLWQEVPGSTDTNAKHPFTVAPK